MGGIRPGPLGSGPPVDIRDGTSALTASPTPGPTRGPYIRGDKFSELPFADATGPSDAKPRYSIKVEIDQEDLSVGAGAYKDSIHLNKNLAFRRGVGGGTGDITPHASVKVIITDESSGKTLPMTRRLVRYWFLQPDQGATAQNQKPWHKVAPEKSNFLRDHPSTQDAPGLRAFKAEKNPVGQLQEFLAGNLKAGGVYYHVITLMDPDGTSRVVTANWRMLDAAEYHAALQATTSARYAESHEDKFLFDVDFPPTDWSSDSGVMTLPHKKAGPKIK